MLKTRALSAAASMALAAAAFAQPAIFTDLGDLSLASGSGNAAVNNAATTISWFRATLPALTATSGFVDLWTNGPGTYTDTEIGVYDNLGAMKSNDDDDGPGFASALSFGKTTPTRPATVGIAPLTGSGIAFNGRDITLNGLGGGVYWIAVAGFNATFNAAAWSVTTTAAAGQTTLYWNIEIPGAPTPPTGVTVHTPASGLAGTMFTASCTVTPGEFPASTGITVSCDASAVGAGTVALLNDGVAPDLAIDNIYTANITTDIGTTDGLKTMIYTVADAQARSSTNNATYNITLPPPSNDECVNAIAVSTGATPFSIVYANNSAATATCGTINKDIWFTFNPPSDGDYQFDTIGCGFDSLLAAYTACDGTQLACNDDGGGSLTSKFNLLGLVSGTPVTIRLGGFGANSGSGNLNISGLTPTAPTAVGAQTPAAPVAGTSVTLTATVTPGANPVTTNHTVNVDLSNLIGGSSSQAFLDDGIAPDVTAGDNVFTYSFAIDPGQGDGTYSCAISINNAELRPGTGSMNVVVVGAAQWDETVNGGADAGDLPASAQVPTGSGTLSNIQGALGTGDMADMYKIEICDAASFSATTNHPVTVLQDTQLFLFDSTGTGVQMNDDGTGMGLRSAMANEFVTVNGNYYLAVSHYDNDPNNATPAEIWADQPFAAVRAPDALGVTDFVVASWAGANTTAFSYRVVMTGVCFAPDNCAADFNADTVVDFFDYLDFVDAFSANDPSADFNNDTVIDFFDYLDFVDAFSAGC